MACLRCLRCLQSRELSSPYFLAVEHSGLPVRGLVPTRGRLSHHLKIVVILRTTTSLNQAVSSCHNLCLAQSSYHACRLAGTNFLDLQELKPFASSSASGESVSELQLHGSSLRNTDLCRDLGGLFLH